MTATSTSSSPTMVRVRCIETTAPEVHRVSRERGVDLNGHGVTSGWGDLDKTAGRDLYVGNFMPASRDMRRLF